MSSSIDIHELPQQWFERSQYRPLVTDLDRDRWFLLAREEMSLKTIGAAECQARAAKPLPDREGLAAAVQSTYEDWTLPCPPQALLQPCCGSVVHVERGYRVRLR